MRMLKGLVPTVFGALGCILASCGETRPPSPMGDDDSGLPPDVEPPDSTTIVLIDQTAWEAVEAAEDPLADHRPPDAYCHEDGTLIHESGTFDVIMDRCSYFMSRQPTLADIRRGDCIEIPFLHGDLISPEGGLSHVALLFGSDPFWERNLPIPSAANSRYEYWLATADIPAGTPIWFHVHNHGPNQYVLGDVAILNLAPGEACPVER
ncbi:MAG: hypothetical protein B7733_07590 [Myxococcales bacterium FL481]|nr:MAG: hypothetical protein B7733_07590 [Myxococcales bacterium FL481]